MSRKAVIFLSVLLYLVTCGKSCDDRAKSEAYRNKAQATAVIDSLRLIFEADTLEPAILEAFEASAMMKFRDFNDFNQIRSDTATARVFRDKAQEMMCAAFLWVDDCPGISPFMIHSLTVGEQFRQLDDTLYEGSLRFTIEPFMPLQNGRAVSQLDGTMRIFLARHLKSFGPDTLKMWDVFLGRMVMDAGQHPELLK